MKHFNRGQRQRTFEAAAAVMIAAAAGSARAGWQEGFEGYAAGASLTSGAFSGWDMVASNAGTIRTSGTARDGSGVLEVGGAATDQVWQPGVAQSGTWTFSVWQYLSSGQAGQTYVILMNDYVAGANVAARQWGVQLKFDLGAGNVSDDFRGGSVAIKWNTWAEVKVVANFDAGTVVSTYDGTTIASGNWSWTSGVLSRINAVDLYTAGGNTAYYDQMALVPTPGTGAAALASLGLLVARKRKRDEAR